jgi:hypothetical protein
MKVFYDSTDDNQVKAVYTSNTTSTAWDSFSSIDVTDPARIAELEDYGLNSRLTIVSGEVTAVTENHTESTLRAELRLRVASEYDQWVEAGIAVSGLSWSPEPLVVLPRDVELLAGVLSISVSKLARGLITDTAAVLNLYKFGDGVIKTDIIEKDLEELSETYQSIRSTRYIAHMNVKGSIDAGVMPTQADYEECGLVLSDFDGLNLT